MNDTDHANLLSLIHRTRNRLWGRRLLQALWYGCCLGAFSLLLSALVHTLFAPVPVAVWLPCLTIPVLLMVLRAALRQRPTCANAAMELDRGGAHDDLLVSAWEMLAIVPGKRPAGAGPVLRRADDVCTRIDLPGVLTTPSPWLGRYRSLPWIVMIVALFLLQLSTPHFHGQLPDGTSTGYAGSAEPWSRSVTRDNLSGQPSNNEGTVSGDWPPGPEAVTETSPVETSVRERVLSAVNTTTGTVVEAARDTAVSGGAGAQDAAAAGGDENPASRGPPAGQAPADTVAQHFEDIARSHGTDPARAISTTGSTGFSEQPNSPGDAPWAVPVTAAAKARGVAHNNLFSLTQRLQIQAYFESLEETP